MSSVRMPRSKLWPPKDPAAPPMQGKQVTPGKDLPHEPHLVMQIYAVHFKLHGLDSMYWRFAIRRSTVGFGKVWSLGLAVTRRCEEFLSRLSQLPSVKVHFVATCTAKQLQVGVLAWHKMVGCHVELLDFQLDPNLQRRFRSFM